MTDGTAGMTPAAAAADAVVVLVALLLDAAGVGGIMTLLLLDWRIFLA